MSNDWDKSNVIATDTNLGYQIPRLWFPHAQPGQGGTSWGEGAPISAGVSMPEPRSRVSAGVDRQIGSDAVVQEYQQMQAFRAYRYLYDKKKTVAVNRSSSSQTGVATVHPLSQTGIATIHPVCGVVVKENMQLPHYRGAGGCMLKSRA